MHPHRIVEDSGYTKILARRVEDKIASLPVWRRWIARIFRAFRKIPKVH
ncbi:hypothetical protein [Burkholderia sp. BCC1047]|nr:hypothetical protein [Burkholderia sp. BCC1047]